MCNETKSRQMGQVLKCAKDYVNSSDTFEVGYGPH